MTTETLIIMIVGIVALAMVRGIVAMVGRDHKSDHADESSPTAVRGSGRQAHLLYPVPPVADPVAAAPAEGARVPRAS
jgi:hypothetical protein